MTKYQELMEKIRIVKEKNYSNFTLSELELIADALETIQVLEIIFKVKENNPN